MYVCMQSPTCQRPQLGSHDDQFVFRYQIRHLTCAQSWEMYVCMNVCMYVLWKLGKRNVCMHTSMPYLTAHIRYVCSHIITYNKYVCMYVGTSPVVSIELMTSRKPSSFISPSVNKNVIRSPAIVK
jgi:hypothetical protein